MRTNPSHISTTSLNRAMHLNLGCLLLHLLFYTSVPALLLARHNPFGNLVVGMLAAALVGIWLCLDFMIPMYMEAKVGRYRNISRPTGWLVSLNLLALGGVGMVLIS